MLLHEDQSRLYEDMFGIKTKEVDMGGYPKEGSKSLDEKIIYLSPEQTKEAHWHPNFSPQTIGKILENINNSMDLQILDKILSLSGLIVADVKEDGIVLETRLSSANNILDKMKESVKGIREVHENFEDYIYNNQERIEDVTKKCKALRSLLGKDWLEGIFGEQWFDQHLQLDFSVLKPENCSEGINNGEIFSYFNNKKYNITFAFDKKMRKLLNKKYEFLHEKFGEITKEKKIELDNANRKYKSNITHTYKKDGQKCAETYDFYKDELCWVRFEAKKEDEKLLIDCYRTMKEALGGLDE